MVLIIVHCEVDERTRSMFIYKDNDVRIGFREGNDYCAASQIAMFLNPDLKLFDENVDFRRGDNHVLICKSLGVPLPSTKLCEVYDANGIEPGSHDPEKVQAACDRFLEAL